MKFPIEIGGANIVLLGNFNPLIFRPRWFEKVELIGQEEAEKAEIEGIEIEHRDFVAFNLEWAKIQVERGRFFARVDEEPLVRVYDLVLGCFRRLRDTPVRVMGINREVHFKTDTEDQWHAIGDRLAPKEPWGDLVISPDGERKGGMDTVIMQLAIPDKENRLRHENGTPGFTRVKVQPSSRVSPGVYVEVNNQFEIEDRKNDVIGCDEIINILEKEWKNSMERSNDIIRRTMELGR